jgi:hypothetical protein
MRSVRSRRAVLVAVAAATALVTVAGCSAGQVAETALKPPSNQGVNQNNSNNTVVIRNLAATYNGPAGYAAGASVPLELGLYNQTTEEVQVLVSSMQPAPGTATEGVVYGTSVVLTGGAGGEPTSTPSTDPSASPSAGPAARPARLTLPPMDSATFLPGDKESIVVRGLSGKLVPGDSVILTFEFSNGAAPLTVPVPVAIPLSPAPRVPGVEGENAEE